MSRTVKFAEYSGRTLAELVKVPRNSLTTEEEMHHGATLDSLINEAKGSLVKSATGIFKATAQKTGHAAIKAGISTRNAVAAGLEKIKAHTDSFNETMQHTIQEVETEAMIQEEINNRVKAYEEQIRQELEAKYKS